MKACTVTYPVWYVWVGAFLVLLAALGTVEALHGTGHWTFFHVAVFAAVGMWWMAYYGVSRTVFSDDGIEQRTLLGVLRLWRRMPRRVRRNTKSSSTSRTAGV